MNDAQIISYVFLITPALGIQSHSVITNSTGPLMFVRYNRDIVITVTSL
jgi:hypothetical protein